MKKVSLSGSPREGVGKKDAKAIRDAGNIPAVLYGGESQSHFSISRLALEKIINTPDIFQIELEIGDKKTNAIIKDMQFHPTTDLAIHVDFLELFADKDVTVGLPVRTVGTAVGVVAGGAKMMNFRTLDVRGLPVDLPEYMELDVTNLEIGDGIRVRDVNVAGCTILQDPSAVIVAVKTTRAAMSAAAGGEGGEGEGAEGEGAEGATAEA
ncbi:MAG: large subunit ribosomal protein L25 [Flavobacteriales bacterium]|jgi:large subunit ribosomal protein L25